MKKEDLIKRYPLLYHMAEEGTWPSIQSIGLLSASAVLDYLNIDGRKRFELESEQRPEKVVLERGAAKIILRDQKPMSDHRLRIALTDGTQPQQWYETINKKVFLWASESRLLKLLGARHYRNLAHDVIVIDTRSLVADYEENIFLCHMNSGNTYPIPHHRGMDAFKRISDYPAKKNGVPTKEVVEVTVDYSVSDVEKYVIEVKRMHGDVVLSRL